MWANAQRQDLFTGDKLTPNFEHTQGGCVEQGPMATNGQGRFDIGLG